MKTTSLLCTAMQKFILSAILAMPVSIAALAQTGQLQERNKDVILKYQERINSGDANGAVQYISKDMKNFGKVVGQDGVRAVLNDVFTTFPDWRAETVEIAAVGDAVIARQKVSGTHLGISKIPVNGGLLVNVLPTGNRFEVPHLHWYTIRDGKIVEHHGNRDDLGMMQQLGLVPRSLPAPGIQPQPDNTTNCYPFKAPRNLSG
ncbi:ester cyclase [Chitinophaga sp. 22620]|uniref:ester cyclase n=1 Tax=Chitinophaga sp. 22620 TaxID=3453952 RepID=UPI003F86756C